LKATIGKFGLELTAQDYRRLAVENFTPPATVFMARTGCAR